MRNLILDEKRTICAVATPEGRGGISVIRLSGQGAEQIMRKFVRLPEALETHKVYYGHFKNPRTNEQIDEVLVTWFSAGRSFTGEPTAEISCHGSPQICSDILACLTSAGAAPADRGEFTFKAFMNGRIDLVQAESVLSLIESRSAESRKQSLRQLSGDLSKTLHDIENKLTWSAAHIEAGIDFSAEDIDVVDHPELLSKIHQALAALKKLEDGYHYGRTVRMGIHVVLVGQPNVGKSSLLNNLCQSDRAIVTDIPGTTRDLVESETLFLDHRFILCDTAGLRASEDPIEKIGIQKSIRSMETADFVFYVYDASKGLTSVDQANLKEIQQDRLILVANKCDQIGMTPADQGEQILVSSFSDATRAALFQSVLRRLQSDGVESSALLLQARHFDLIQKMIVAISRAIEIIESREGVELAAVDLKEAVLFLHEILGKRFDDDIMDRVFREFCIGK